MSGIEKQFADLNGTRMAYVEIGEGDPIVFLHGNPTSSYLWRHVIGEVADLGRCLAPDLIGMGDSDELADSGPGCYMFAEHCEYLDAWFESVGATREVTLVGHDWGSALGFVGRVGILRRFAGSRTWKRRPSGPLGGISAARGRAVSGAAVPGRRADDPGQNMFVEAILPAGVLSPMTAEVLEEYRRPFAAPGEGRLTLSWPRQIPLDGEPADVTAIMEDYGAWLAGSRVRKLFVNADPGQILVGSAREFCRTWPNQTEVTVPGLHVIQEDSGKQIGQAIRAWLKADPPTAVRV